MPSTERLPTALNATYSVGFNQFSTILSQFSQFNRFSVALFGAFVSNHGLPIYPAFLGSVCMGHLSAIVLVLSISVWFSVGSRCRCLRNRLAEALRWRRVLPPCLSCSMNQMNQQGGQSCAAQLHIIGEMCACVSRNK